jgi:inosose dehydratase
MPSGRRLVMNRRDFLASSAIAVAVQSLPVFAASDNIKFGVASINWVPSLEQAIPLIGKLGFAGVEPFAQNVAKYRADPAALKALLDAAGLVLISCSNNGAVMSTDFLDPAKAQQTISDHVAFARNFLHFFGCDHFKISVGSRHDDTPMTAAQIKQMSTTLNEIGRQTIELGIRLAPHPLIGSPLERESEVRGVMDSTDPRYVGIVMDTGHLTLGGIDPVKIIRDYFPRIAEIHLKDTEAKYRGWTGPSYRDPRPYRVAGSANCGGVDFPAIYKMMQVRGYSGFCSLDIDGFDVNGDTADLVAANARYLTDTLHVPLAPR